MHEEDAGILCQAHGRVDRLQRHPAQPPPGYLLLHHRRQLRLRLLLVPLPGRHHRVRGQGHRHRVHQRLPGGRIGLHLRARPGPRRPLPPAPLQRPAGHGDRRRREPGRGSGRGAPGHGAGNPRGNAFSQKRTVLARESEAVRDADGTKRQDLAHLQPGLPEPSRRPRGLQAPLRRASPPCWRIRIPRSPARRFRHEGPVGDPHAEDERYPHGRLRQPAPPAVPACPPTWPRTATSMARTSWCGTRSA